MNSLAAEIRATVVAPDTVHVWWLAQAGFVFKTPAGRVIYVDPYLSDAVARLHGFKRLSLAPLTAEEVTADLVINSHEHTDHLDPDALPIIARRNPQCRFAGSRDCQPLYAQFGIPAERCQVLEPDQTYPCGDLTIHTVLADHGDYAPTAVALLLDFGGVRVFYPGDTALRPARFARFCALQPELLLPCINGNFGNMNHIDAARLTQQAKPQVVVPCHFWMFAEHGGDPAAFLHACKFFAPETQAMLLKPGEGLVCRKRKA